MLLKHLKLLIMCKLQPHLQFTPAPVEETEEAITECPKVCGTYQKC